MSEPLYVALVWHMHQPYYPNDLDGAHLLPWVRLHAAKDYLRMARVLGEYPMVHATFNLTPCLVEQVLQYLEEGRRDKYLELSLKPAQDLTRVDKELLLDLFFDANIEHAIRRYPRYWQLFQLRQLAGGDVTLFDVHFWRDLQALFNLAWIDSGLIERDDALRRLRDKGRHFTSGEVRAVLAQQRAIMERWLPCLRELEARGQVELSTSPYFHPILPLLIDVGCAREASPGLPLPCLSFSHPEDALEQLRLALQAHAQRFGTEPRGLWPSEGAVSQELLAVVRRLGHFRWLASDEEILARSLGLWVQRDSEGNVTNPHPLYRPYRAPGGDKGRDDLALIFRDHVLSDRIGFVYGRMESKRAAEDLVARLHVAHERLRSAAGPHLVSIILDGENCWEGYEDNGNPFLHHLYGLLSKDAVLKTMTVSEFLEEHPAQERLPRLFSGSWIGHNLETWVGEEEQNLAWDALAEARQQLTTWQADNLLTDLTTLAAAWREVYIAEGSDWFWWYYSRNSSGHDELFDRYFREHLGNVHRIIGLPVPASLKEPIRGKAPRPMTREISGYISPRLVASRLALTDWAQAGCAEPLPSGAMQPGSRPLSRFYFGHNHTSLYLRVESQEGLAGVVCHFYLATGMGPSSPLGNSWPAIPDSLHAFAPSVQITVEAERRDGFVAKAGEGGWQRLSPLSTLAVSSHVLELSVPFALLGMAPGGALDLVVILERGGTFVQAFPESGPLSFALREF